jgi:DNA-binding transcriptional LysR family regulator
MFTELPAAIGSFRRRYPRAELRLRELATSAQITALADGMLDLAFLRDGDPTPGIEIHTLLAERYVAVLPRAHALASRAVIRMEELRAERFILFARQMGPLAYDRTVGCCQEHGFYPNIVQDAPQWPTLVRLVAAGLGVSLAPACVANVAIPGAVYRKLEKTGRTTVDLAVKAGRENALARNFAAIAREHLLDAVKPAAGARGA